MSEERRFTEAELKAAILRERHRCVAMLRKEVSRLHTLDEKLDAIRNIVNESRWKADMIGDVDVHLVHPFWEELRALVDDPEPIEKLDAIRKIVEQFRIVRIEQEYEYNARFYVEIDGKLWDDFNDLLIVPDVDL